MLRLALIAIDSALWCEPYFTPCGLQPAPKRGKSSQIKDREHKLKYNAALSRWPNCNLQQLNCKGLSRRLALDPLDLPNSERCPLFLSGCAAFCMVLF